MSWVLRDRPRDPDAERALSLREQACEESELTADEVAAIERRRAAVAALKKQWAGRRAIPRRRLDQVLDPVGGARS